MKHILIITGGYLNMEFAKAYIGTLSYDKVFAADKGLEYVDALGLIPDYIVGDFDTVTEPLLMTYERKIQNGELTAYIERHPVKKDATDTELALQKALNEGAERITVLAATGSRLDHVLGNLGLLLQADSAGSECFIVDETNRVQLLNSGGKRSCSIKKDKQHGSYLSIIPMSESVDGVTVRGVMYPLENQTLHPGNSLTVSNQIVEEEAYISVKRGTALIIESRDQ